MVEVTADAVFARLRAARIRLTAPRRAVVDALLALGSHATAEQLHEHVRVSHPDVSASSVYRTMDLLTELGIVTHVHLGHGPAEYHLAHERHAHLVCERCGAVAELPDELTAPLATAVRRRLGFEVHLQHFALTGRCASCGPAFDPGGGARPG